MARQGLVLILTIVAAIIIVAMAIYVVLNFSTMNIVSGLILIVIGFLVLSIILGVLLMIFRGAKSGK